MRPEDIARQEHRDYYSEGSYDQGRFHWTLRTFFPNCRGKRILEIGCGDGRLLSELQVDNDVYGIDAAETGVEKCRGKHIQASCLDVSSEALPFSSDYFDLVIVLETLEHLMNPYYALHEMRRVLKENGRLICSVPNPWTGHPYLYPGLFEFSNFKKFLEQCGFCILRVEPWEWAPRETFVPRALRGIGIFRSRYLAGAARRVVERTWRAAGRFPWFCYWLWTFECANVNKSSPTVLRQQAHLTKPKC
jgi:SAM-dependent methyltransferase